MQGAKVPGIQKKTFHDSERAIGRYLPKTQATLVVFALDETQFISPHPLSLNWFSW